MGATGSPQSPQSAPMDPRLRPPQGGWDWDPERPEEVPTAAAAASGDTQDARLPAS